MDTNNHCCDSVKQTKLLPLEEALEKLLKGATPPGDTEEVTLKNTLNRVLSKDLVSQINVPPHDNSAVDGYAVFAESVTAAKPIDVVMRVPAGTHPAPLEEGKAARIFTGATIPEGANCVVMQEDTTFDSASNCVVLNDACVPGANIRPAGQDIQNGKIVLDKGTRLSPQHLGLAASIGNSTLPVFKRLRIAILSTGDELVEPGNRLEPSQIYNSNRYLLQGLLDKLNVDVVDMGVIADKLEETKEALNTASSEADIIITTGGASVGEEDHIQNAIKQLGSINFWRIALKPGKPFMYGKVNDTPVLGLPGNPGAVFVTFLLLARPYILKAQGKYNVDAQPINARLGFDVKKAGKRREFLRVKYENGHVVQHPNQSSGILSSAAWADGLAVIKENTAPKRGDSIDYYPFTLLMDT